MTSWAMTRSHYLWMPPQCLNSFFQPRSLKESKWHVLLATREVLCSRQSCLVQYKVGFLSGLKWVYEYWTSPDFKWWKVVGMQNGPVLICHFNNKQPNHLITIQIVVWTKLVSSQSSRFATVKTINKKSAFYLWHHSCSKKVPVEKESSLSLGGTIIFLALFPSNYILWQQHNMSPSCDPFRVIIEY